MQTNRRIDLSQWPNRDEQKYEFLYFIECILIAKLIDTNISFYTLLKCNIMKLHMI